MNRLLTLVLTAVLMPAAASAGTVSNFGDLDFGSYQLLNTVIDNVDNSNLAGVQVTSSVYSNGSEFLYAYQIINNSAETLQDFVIPGMPGTVSGTLGYVYLGLPAEFNPAISVVPAYAQISGDSVQFEFNSVLALTSLAPDTASAVLVVKTTNGWSTIQASVSNTQTGALSQTGGVDVVAVVPEPASMALLSLGALTLVRRRR